MVCKEVCFSWVQVRASHWALSLLLLERTVPHAFAYLCINGVTMLLHVRKQLGWRLPELPLEEILAMVLAKDAAFLPAG